MIPNRRLLRPSFGMVHFEYKFPGDPSYFVLFRKSKGKVGSKKNCRLRFDPWKYCKGKSDFIGYNCGRKHRKTPLFQGMQNLPKKIIDKCNGIAQKEGIAQRQTFFKKPLSN